MNNKRKISRREGIKKIGYVTFSAATMMILLNDPLRAQPPHSPPGGGPPWDDGPGPPDNPGRPFGKSAWDKSFEEW